MKAVSDNAKLVSTFEGPSVVATVSRSEILDILRSGEEPQLVLEVARSDNREAEPNVLRFDWDRNELATLLRESEGDAVTLMFDEAAIERALARADVEAHGLREKAVVLAVVAATATAAAGAAAPPTIAGTHPAPPPRGPVHPAEGTGFIPTPGIERTAPPRGARHPAEGTGFVPTPTGVASVTDSASGPFETTGAIAAGAAVLITGLAFAARGRRQQPTVRPA